MKKKSVEEIVNEFLSECDSEGEVIPEKEIEDSIYQINKEMEEYDIQYKVNEAESIKQASELYIN